MQPVTEDEPLLFLHIITFKLAAVILLSRCAHSHANMQLLMSEWSREEHLRAVKDIYAWVIKKPLKK